jgi:hypothetical protein
MNRFSTLFLSAIFLFLSSSLFAQVKQTTGQSGAHQSYQTVRHAEYGNGTVTATPSNGFPDSHLSPQIVVPGADMLPISSHYDVGTNSRSMHNLIVDPDDPQKLHFMAMETTSNSPSDTVGGKYPSRRVAYTYSANGGKTWTTPVTVGNVRLGFPSMILYKRGGKNVPIIAAHNGPNNADGTNWTSYVYIEQGNPGDGNFKLFAADRISSDESTKDIGYPSIAVNATQDTLYVAGCPLQATTSAPPGNLEFGKYALDANRNAVWLGWKIQPGGNGNATALCAGGEYLLRVAPNGKLGVLWAQGDNSDRGLYYVESKDGGATWTTTYGRLYAPDGSGPGGILADYNGLDFWFDQTSKPHYLWEGDYQVSSSNTFYPYSAMIFYWALGDTNVKILNVNSGFTLPFTQVIIYDTSNINVAVVNQSSYFTPPASTANVEPTGVPFVSNVTPALSTNPNFFRVFYSTFQDGDTLTVDQTGDGSSIKIYLYRSIYYQETKDGGNTWSDPTPFIANNPNDPPSNKNDYHFPAPSLMNYLISGGNIQYQANVMIDSFPGQQFNLGQAGWSFNTWYHFMQLRSKVLPSTDNSSSSLAQNFPNPFNTSTTIPIVMKNDDMVTISVADILGREVSVIYNGRLSEGEHRIPFTAPNLGAGIYTYTLKTSSGSISRTMSLVK